ncbi:MAG: hypothetical protein PHC75_07790 [Burkholderiales bacterium]|nr:hypothetical protein [Burkholderiales bacterium]
MKVIIIGGVAFDETPLLPFINKFTDSLFININNDDLANIQNQIITEICKKEETLLIGYSTGGLILLSVYQEIKHLPLKLVMLNSTPYFMAEPLWNGIFLKDYKILFTKLESLGLAQFCEYFAALAAYPLKNPKKFKQNTCIDKNYLVKWMNFLKNTDLREQLSKISIPLLLINSTDDILAKTNLLPDNPYITKYILSSSTHSILNYDELNKILEEFYYVK